MKKLSCYWIFIIAIISITVFISLLEFAGTSSADKPLTNNEANQLVQDRYQGVVSDIQLSNNQYSIKLKKDDSLYNIKIDAKTGEILSMVKTKNTTFRKNNQELTEAEVKNMVTEKTKGIITSIEKFNEDGKAVYKVTVTQSNQQTTIKLDAVSGTELLQSTNVLTEPVKKLTEAEASQLAKNQVNGTVDHVLLETKDGQPYYLIKVSTPNKQEAVVQIHAITGKVVSVTWDDHLDSGSKDH
jgi:uncharacterized membrane protein YkoI